MDILINWLIMALAILASAYLLPGVSVTSFGTALIVALVLGIINAIIRPILLFLTLPLNVLTLGLFTFVVNALLIMLTDSLVDGLTIMNFWWALLFSVILSVINSLMHSTAGKLA